MADESFDYLSTMKVLLGMDANDDSKESILQLYWDITVQSILNYCNISELPSALNYVACELACDAYRDSGAKNDVGGIVGNVSGVSEDGRRVEFGNAAYVKTYLNDRITRTRELNRFKKVYRLRVEESSET